MKLFALVCLCLLAPSAAANGAAVYKMVREGGDVVLPCSLSSRKEISTDLFDWKKDPFKPKPDEVFLYDAGVHYNNGRPGQTEHFRGRVSHFPEELKHGNASIIIRNTEVGDSGNYTCDFPRLRPRQLFKVQLVVVGRLKDRRKEQIPGAASEPCITSIKETKDSSLLQCVVKDAFPEPRLEWQDGSGNKLPAKEPQVLGRDTILQTTVTKTNHYYCVATQETINHQIRAGTHVYIRESPIGTVAAAIVISSFSTLLLVGVLLFVLVRKDCISLSGTQESPVTLLTNQALRLVPETDPPVSRTVCQ